MRESVREYVEAAVESLTDWSRQSGQRLIELVRREVQRQMKILGVATRDELSELKKRVRALERERQAPPSAKKATSAKSSGRKRGATAKPARPGRKPPGPRPGGA